LPEEHNTKEEHAERYAQALFSGNEPGLRWGRRVFKRLPSSPRCKMCASPFAAPLGPLMRTFGKAPWPKNPKYCTQCFNVLLTHRGGTEIDCSLLFADVRGSTSLAEGMRPAAFSGLMNRFFETASRILVGKDAMVDKFVGDEIIGIFLPVMTGPAHARNAIEAGRELLVATGNETDAPWLPIGIGVNTGLSYVGTVGEGDNIDITAMGDPVNVTARLAGAAGAGEMLVTAAAFAAAELAESGLERRRLDLKGKSEQTEVVVFRSTN
jgi:adenylate cyclase